MIVNRIEGGMAFYSRRTDEGLITTEVDYDPDHKFVTGGNPHVMTWRQAMEVASTFLELAASIREDEQRQMSKTDIVKQYMREQSGDPFLELETDADFEKADVLGFIKTPINDALPTNAAIDKAVEKILAENNIIGPSFPWRQPRTFVPSPDGKKVDTRPHKVWPASDNESGD